MVLNPKKVPSFDYDDVDVLEFERRPYKNKKGEDVVFTSCLLRLDSKVFRFTVSKDCDLTNEVGNKVSLRFELSTWGDDLTPSIRVASII